MYNFGGSSCCGCNGFSFPNYTTCCPSYNWCCSGNYGGTSSYAIVLVLFILLVIVIGSRFVR